MDSWTRLADILEMTRRYPTTAQILAERALDMPCGQVCVDWAVGLLVEGFSSRQVEMLASLDPPFNLFDVAELRDRALREVNAPDLQKRDAVYVYARERLLSLLAGQDGLGDVLGVLKDLCIEHDMDRNLLDFYLLYFAYDGLVSFGDQYYWEGATRDNIESIVLERARAFVESGLGRVPDSGRLISLPPV
jgi:hypothetical protein